MFCPVCKTQTLVQHTLDAKLISQKCETCGGQWINSFQFWKWLEDHRGTLPPAAEVGPAGPPTGETPGVKMCPECGHIMARYKVGHALGFSLDRCGNCGGIWFDKDEWEILQGGDLRDQIHLIFSEAWQRRVRDAEHVEHLKNLFVQKVGEKDFAEIQRIRDWLNHHPYRRELLGFLNGGEF